MRLQASIIFILLCTYSQAQFYEVINAKKAIKQVGHKVRKGDQISRFDTITINEKGSLILKTETAMPLKFGVGTFLIYEEAKRHNRWYNKHLILTGELKRKNLISCKFNYKTITVPGSDRHFEMDRIETDQKGLVRIKSEADSLAITWHNPDYQYKGKYYVVLRDFYNQGFIDVLETEVNNIVLFPFNYDHRHMYYSIIAEDCRASLRYKIEILGNDVYANEWTNFLKPEVR